MIYHLLSGIIHTCLYGSQKSHLSFPTLSSITSSLALHWCAEFYTPFVFTKSKFNASILLRYFKHFLQTLAECGFQGRQQGEGTLMTLPSPWFENMASRGEEMETHDCLQSESFNVIVQSLFFSFTLDGCQVPTKAILSSPSSSGQRRENTIEVHELRCRQGEIPHWLLMWQNSLNLKKSI